LAESQRAGRRFPWRAGDGRVEDGADRGSTRDGRERKGEVEIGERGKHERQRKSKRKLKSRKRIKSKRKSKSRRVSSVLLLPYGLRP
jgi:hypothetical protein